MAKFRKKKQGRKKEAYILLIGKKAGNTVVQLLVQRELYHLYLLREIIECLYSRKPDIDPIKILYCILYSQLVIQ